MTHLLEQEFVNAVKGLVCFWMRQKQCSEQEKLEGLAFSILCMMDGVTGSFEGAATLCNIDDNGNKIDIEEGESMLHELFCQDTPKPPK